MKRENSAAGAFRDLHFSGSKEVRSKATLAHGVARSRPRISASDGKEKPSRCKYDPMKSYCAVRASRRAKTFAWLAIRNGAGLGRVSILQASRIRFLSGKARNNKDVRDLILVCAEKTAKHARRKVDADPSNSGAAGPFTRSGPQSMETRAFITHSKSPCNCTCQAYEEGRCIYAQDKARV